MMNAEITKKRKNIYFGAVMILDSILEKMLNEKVECISFAMIKSMRDDLNKGNKDDTVVEVIDGGMFR